MTLDQLSNEGRVELILSSVPATTHSGSFIGIFGCHGEQLYAFVAVSKVLTNFGGKYGTRKKWSQVDD
jgi:hypothetical protein